MGRNREQWDVPARDAGADGFTSRCESAWLGLEFRAPDYDSVIYFRS